MHKRDAHDYAQWKRDVPVDFRSHVSYTFLDPANKDQFPRGEHVCPDEPVFGDGHDSNTPAARPAVVCTHTCTHTHTHACTHTHLKISLGICTGGYPIIYDTDITTAWLKQVATKFPESNGAIPDDEDGEEVRDGVADDPPDSLVPEHCDAFILDGEDLDECQRDGEERVSPLTPLQRARELLAEDPEPA
jgi:hypothetical protein